MKLIVLCTLLLCACSLRSQQSQVAAAASPSSPLKQLIEKVRSISRQAAQDNLSELKEDNFPDADETLMKFLQI